MKSICFPQTVNGLWSPPSRGAWIEITKNFRKANGTRVAPLAGGVD